MNIISYVFVFITLFAVGLRWISEGGVKPQESATLAAIWAVLGTFFVHDLM